MAVRLFKDRLISVGSAAKMTGESMADMLTRLSRLGVPVVDYDESSLVHELSAATAWIKPVLLKK